LVNASGICYGLENRGHQDQPLGWRMYRAMPSLDVDDLAVEVVRVEGFFRAEQVAIQEQGGVAWVDVEDGVDPRVDLCQECCALEAARFDLVLEAEKDGGVKGLGELVAARLAGRRDAELAKPNLTEIVDREIDADLGGGDQAEGFEEKERGARVAGQLPHEKGGALLREDSGDEECLGWGVKPDKTSVGFDLMADRGLRIWRGRHELFIWYLHHLAEV
jgi:hypothetical protein